MTNDFRVLGVDHITVTTPEELEGDVLEWYQACLGLERVEKPEGARPSGGWFRVGEQEIHVSIDPRTPLRTSHFGLVVDDFDVTVDRLRTQGCHIEQATLIPGRHRCFTRDPAGNQIEIVAFDETTAEVAYEEGAAP